MKRLGGEGLEALATLALYEARVRPAVGRQLERWRGVAAQIPDPQLRRGALGALTEKAANAEATAVFATLAPRARRAAALHASVALQVAVDYLDSLGERPGGDPLRDGLQLHEALVVALTPGAETDDWYRHHPAHEDGGYLDRLVGACQLAVASLPSGERVLPAARRAAARCGEGQSHTHAAALAGERELAGWAEALPDPGGGYRWWELAAGACSSVAAHALIALAAEPAATAAQASAVDAAYYPSVGALTVLLDDLVDRAADRAAGEHNYIDYYAGGDDGAERLVAIASDARRATAGLPRRRRHGAILTGVLAYYLARSAGADAEPVRERLLASEGPVLRGLTALLSRRGL